MSDRGLRFFFCSLALLRERTGFPTLGPRASDGERSRFYGLVALGKSGAVRQLPQIDSEKILFLRMATAATMRASLDHESCYDLKIYLPSWISVSPASRSQ
jgi:hypothetical protein